MNATPITPTRRADLLAGLACTVVSLFLAVVPHLTTLAWFGTSEFLSEADDLYYLSVAKGAYYGEPALSDPFVGPEPRVPSIYPAALFLPLANLSRLLGLSTVQMGLVWRVVGGLLIGPAFYFLFRRMFADLARSITWSVLCTLICLGDGGLIEGRSFLANFLNLHHLWHGTSPTNKPDFIPLYRIFYPLLCLPMPLVVVGVLLPDRLPGRPLLALGIVAMGLCVLTNFYLWTSTVGALFLWGSVLLLRPSWLLPSRTETELDLREARAWRGYLCVVIGGLILGLPAILDHVSLLLDPQIRGIMSRIGKAIQYRPFDPDQLRGLLNFWVWVKLVLGLVAVVILKIPRLGLVWTMVLAAFALRNSAILTGKDFENTLFSVAFGPFGEILLLGIAVRFAVRLQRQRELLAIFTALAAVLVFSAAALRVNETLHAPAAVENRQHLQELGPIRPVLASASRDASFSLPRESKAAALLCPAFPLYFQPYSWSSHVPIRTINERHALNGWLQGLDLETYFEHAAEDTKYSPDPEFSTERVAEQRRRIFESLLAGASDELLERHRVRYLLLREGSPPPTRGGPWTLVAEVPGWSFWERVTGRTPANDVVPGPED